MIILIYISLTFIFMNLNSNKDKQIGLICQGNDIMKEFESGKTELYGTCGGNTYCIEELDGSVSCDIYDDGVVVPGGGSTITTCPFGTYLGQNNICFDYPGKDLPQNLDYESCIKDALQDYYSNFQATTYIISWITGKTVEDDQYDPSDSWWKYIGCASVRDSNGAWVAWGVTSDCKTGRSGDMLTNIQSSSHNVCGSERLRG